MRMSVPGSAVLGSMILVMALAMPADAADAPAQVPAPAAARQGIDLLQLLEMSAERLKKRFIIDPRVRGEVLLVNVDPQRITYAELQAILSVYGFVATQEMEGTVRIVPDANMRQLPMPLLGQDDKRIGEEEVVMRTIDAGALHATQLVPLLRPLLPQPAHLVADPQTNTLIVVARRASVRLIEDVVRDLRARPVVQSSDDKDEAKQAK